MQQITLFPELETPEANIETPTGQSSNADDQTITIETTVAWPAKWREKDGERVIYFTIPMHGVLAPYLATSPKAIPCYYRNLRFKYGTLTKGTWIRLTASIDKGKRGGVQLHLKELEVIGTPVVDLTKVDSKMMKKWTKQIEKQYAAT